MCIGGVGKVCVLGGDEHGLGGGGVCLCMWRLTIYHYESPSHHCVCVHVELYFT